MNTFPDPKPASRAGSGFARRLRSYTGLARDITLILLVKAAVLFVIWWLWFSAPAARHMQLPPERVQDRLISAPAAAAPRPPPSLATGNNHHAAH